MRIAVLEIPQQGDERNDFSVLSGFNGKLTLSDWTVACGFFRRLLVFFAAGYWFLPVYRRSCRARGQSGRLGCGGIINGAIPNADAPLGSPVR
ncbi:hypothetical protein FQZ97_1157970 [compost metagenome]